jgi:hypothetical protein
MKTPKSSPFTDLGGESKEKKNHEGFMHTSPNKSPRKLPRNLSKKIAKRRLRKTPKKENWEELKQALRNTPNHLYIP